MVFFMQDNDIIWFNLFDILFVKSSGLVWSGKPAKKSYFSRENVT